MSSWKASQHSAGATMGPHPKDLKGSYSMKFFGKSQPGYYSTCTTEKLSLDPVPQLFHEEPRPFTFALSWPLFCRGSAAGVTLSLPETVAPSPLLLRSGRDFPKWLLTALSPSLSQPDTGWLMYRFTSDVSWCLQLVTNHSVLNPSFFELEQWGTFVSLLLSASHSVLTASS